MTLGGFLCLAILGAAPALAMSQTSPPSWARTPDAARLLDAYPAKALQAGAGGQAVLDCVLQLDGKVRDCKVKREEPADLGFGAAALALASEFELKPGLRDGQPIADARLSIPVRFSPPPVISKPKWVRLPTGDELVALWPPAALARGIGGKAIIVCIVSISGSVGGCVMDSETPAGYGFGAAALSLAPYFQMSPATQAGVPVAGGVVKIPIVFQNDGGGPGIDTPAVRRLFRTLNWAQQPSRAEVAAFAGADGRDQTVSLQCDFDPDGRLRACQPLIRGAPPALETAALKLTRGFIAETGPKPSPQAGDKVEVAIHFAAHPLSEADLAKAPPLQTFEFDYVRRPAAADLALPDAAVKAGRTTGWAALQCTVADRGALADCGVTAEEAPGLGLGAAAIRAVGHVAVATWNSLGDSTLGRRINFRIVLTAPAPAAASPAAPAK